MANDTFSSGNQDSNSKDSIILDNILSKEEAKKNEEIKSIFGQNPLKILNKKPAIKPSRFNPGWSMVKASMLIAILIFAYFHIQLNLTNGFFTGIFGENYLTQTESKFNQVITAQTEINSRNYLIAALDLDKFVYLADSYLYKQNQISSPFIGSSEKTKLTKEAETVKNDISSTLIKVREKLNSDLWPASDSKGSLNVEKYRMALIQKLISDKNSLLTETSTEGNGYLEDDLRKQMQKVNTANALVKDSEFKNLLNDLNLEDLKKENINELLTAVNRVAGNDLSVIAKIKEQRVTWSQVIEDIEKITKDVDSLYGHAAFQGLQDIHYNSFSFDADAGEITINGDAEREDMKNFTLLANLIDAIESSKAFKNVSGRTFSKTIQGDIEGLIKKYVSPLSLTFERQIEEEHEGDSLKSLDKQELSN